jgi:diphthamide synthase subunit DPH2
MEVVPDYVKGEYRRRIDAHLEQLKSRTKSAGMDYHLLVTDKPLDSALSEYLFLRPRGN